MPNVAELIRERVTLTVDCVTRLHLSLDVPRLQSEGGFAALLRHPGQPIPPPTLFGQITAPFKTRLHTQAAATGSAGWTSRRASGRMTWSNGSLLASSGRTTWCVGMAQERIKA